eukprot:TRINITY_DN2383_c0_g1_i3.p1 TRINITY_DN2383_c0_g1~~TRINITY_DN2383_c0_g1_i3.p1  ORF type:complete len:126 (-),score=31.47 TRINITY_DN2383_c0_g1_i3:378-755(-)
MAQKRKRREFRDSSGEDEWPRAGKTSACEQRLNVVQSQAPLRSHLVDESDATASNSKGTEFGNEVSDSENSHSHRQVAVDRRQRDEGRDRRSHGIVKMGGEGQCESEILAAEEGAALLMTLFYGR